MIVSLGSRRQPVAEHSCGQGMYVLSNKGTGYFVSNSIALLYSKVSSSQGWAVRRDVPLLVTPVAGHLRRCDSPVFSWFSFALLRLQSCPLAALRCSMSVPTTVVALVSGVERLMPFSFGTRGGVAY